MMLMKKIILFSVSILTEVIVIAFILMRPLFSEVKNYYNQNFSKKNLIIMKSQLSKIQVFKILWNKHQFKINKNKKVIFIKNDPFQDKNLSTKKIIWKI